MKFVPKTVVKGWRLDSRVNPRKWNVTCINCAFRHELHTSNLSARPCPCPRCGAEPSKPPPSSPYMTYIIGTDPTGKFTLRVCRTTEFWRTLWNMPAAFYEIWQGNDVLGHPVRVTSLEPADWQKVYDRAMAEKASNDPLDPPATP